MYQVAQARERAYPRSSQLKRLSVLAPLRIFSHYEDIAKDRNTNFIKYERINEIVAFVWAVRYLLFNYQTHMNESMIQVTSRGYSTP